jgi:murein DD-endopeptidase MepM/ murein hydrolase activator NlpD
MWITNSLRPIPSSLLAPNPSSKSYVKTPVRASQTGQVVLAEPLFFAGNTVIIDHGLGIYTLYGHLSEIEARVGDRIAVGAVLGKVGATGRVTGPHLHWGLSVDRSRVNALQIVTFAQL